MTLLSAFSYGGGVQSTAALVLAAEGRLPGAEGSFVWDAFIFANVGEHAENPQTLAYVNEVAKPYAEEHGIEIVEVCKTLRDGSRDDLYDAMMGGRRDQPIPIRGQDGQPLSRACTMEWKIRAINRELRRRGARNEDGARAVVGLGISLDEIQRAKHWGKVDPQQPTQILHYPLLTLRLRRDDCTRIIREAGLPVPSRSACFFCPFSSLDAWRRLKRNQPEQFAKSVALERHLNEVNAEKGRRPVWLTRYARPLDEVVQDQLVMDMGDLDNCESGYCLT